MTAWLNRTIGKRFAGLLIVTACLMWGYLHGAEHFPSLATTLGLIYGAYVGGQSWTDVAEAKG
jgi:hypothetical protein